jgi:hypothetical protein
MPVGKLRPGEVKCFAQHHTASTTELKPQWKFPQSETILVSLPFLFSFGSLVHSFFFHWNCYFQTFSCAHAIVWSPIDLKFHHIAFPEERLHHTEPGWCARILISSPCRPSAHQTINTSHLLRPHPCRVTPWKMLTISCDLNTDPIAKIHKPYGREKHWT